MTGYGYAEKAHSVFSLSVEIKSYNNRYLEIICNLPPFLSGYELEISNMVSEKAARGRVEVFVKVKTLKSDLQVVVDKEVVERLSEAFARIGAISGKALK
ncbi:MAG TPA: YicC family protein, partial [Sphaerochaeta sp.]|nr:YicC family protein [Sphaerochaeta sp.]